MHCDVCNYSGIMDALCTPGASMWTADCEACMCYAQTNAPAGMAASPAEHREVVLLGQRSPESGRIWGVVVAVGQLARNRLGGCIGTHLCAHSLKLKELQEVHLAPKRADWGSGMGDCCPNYLLQHERDERPAAYLSVLLEAAQRQTSSSATLPAIEQERSA